MADLRRTPAPTWWVLLVPGMLLVGCHTFEALTAEGAPAAPSSECGSCHVEIHEEWATSPHAGAWTAPAFLEATSRHRYEACLGCHAPESIHVEGEPVLRSTAREEGVNCRACHLLDGAMVGPAPSTALFEPHPVVIERESYHQSVLCGTCHVGTYQEWQAAPAGTAPKPTCQACHMPPVERRLTQGTGLLTRGLVRFEEPFAGRRHRFGLEPVEVTGAAVEARLAQVVREAGALRCRLEVIGRIPHRIPTGDFGFRRVQVEVLGREGGAMRQLLTTDLYKELGTALEPGETRSFTVEGTADLTQVQLRLWRARREGEPVLLQEQVWTVP